MTNDYNYYYQLIYNCKHLAITFTSESEYNFVWYAAYTINYYETNSIMIL